MCESRTRVSYDKCRLSAETIEVTYNSTTKEIKLFDADFYKKTTNHETDVLQTFDAKYCKCADDPHNEQKRYYCLIQNDENSCSVPSSWKTKRIHEEKRLTHVSCYKSGLMDRFIKSVWLPVFFINILLLASYFTTRCAVMPTTYIFGKCFSCINRRLVEKELARERAMRRELREMMSTSRRESPDGRMQRLSLHLKTKSFFGKKQEHFEDDVGRKDIKSKESCYDDHDNTQTMCSICMIDIVHRDKIGDLECGHEFHIECLKSWITVRNTCPLCNASNIAITKVTLHDLRRNTHAHKD